MRQNKSAPRIILFLRYPAPGQVKTRLIPALGPAGAAALQRWMGGRALEAARNAAQRLPATVEVRHTGAPEAAFRDWLGLEPEYLRPQADGDLGQRMAAALAQAFAEGAGKVVLIGSDCPALTGEVLANAFARLRTSDLVLGPARDGGYYLIGLNGCAPRLFTGIAWGSAEVLPETFRRAEAARLSVALLETLPDIDRPEDLSLLPGYGYRAMEET